MLFMVKLFNNSLLCDEEYLKCVVKRQYCLLVYNYDTIQQVDNSALQININDQLFLETLLMEIRRKTTSYSSYKAKERRTREQFIIEEILNIKTSSHENNQEDDGNLIYNQNQILQATCTFYESLYTKRKCRGIQYKY